jgi:hypothetical protein
MGPVERFAQAVLRGDDLVCLPADVAAAVISELERRAALVLTLEQIVKAKTELIDILTAERNLWEYEARRG